MTIVLCRIKLKKEKKRYFCTCVLSNPATDVVRVELAVVNERLLGVFF